MKTETPREYGNGKVEVVIKEDPGMGCTYRAHFQDDQRTTRGYANSSDAATSIGKMRDTHHITFEGKSGEQIIPLILEREQREQQA